MKNYFFNNPVFRLVAPAVYSLLIYLLILLVNNDVRAVDKLFTAQELYVTIALTYLSLETVRVSILILGRITKRASTSLAIAAQVFISSLLSVGLVLLALMAYFKYVIGFSIGTSQLIIFSTLYTATALLYNVMYLGHHFLHKENTVRISAENQQRAVLETEMMEYRNDVNPDLLYESLENLIGIMYKDVERAEDYIDCLGAAYRYVLTNRENEVVTIREELEAGTNIIRLLNAKYGGQLKLACSIKEDDLNKMLIPGSLPALLEGLVRNTIVAGDEPFVVRIYMEEEYLTLEAKLNDRLIIHHPSEQAFERLQRSYSIYTELPLIKVKAYQQNYIKLPVLTFEETGVPE